jgi:hypothetical protein
VSKRTIIGSIAAVAIVGTIVSVTSLARRPVLGAPLGRPALKPVAQVQAPDPETVLAREECLSTAFIDYTPDARGKATVRAAVRAYRPGARNLRIKTFARDRAEVEEFRGTTRIATYGLFWTARTGWLVDRADIYSPCTPTE